MDKTMDEQKSKEFIKVFQRLIPLFMEFLEENSISIKDGKILLQMLTYIEIGCAQMEPKD